MNPVARVVRRTRAAVRGRAATSRATSAAVRRAAAARGRVAAPPGAVPVHVLVGPPGAGNTGDLAMVEAFVENVSGRVVVVERNPGDLRLAPHLSASADVVSLPHLVYGRGAQRTRDLEAFAELLDTAASLSVVGADMLDGGYSLTGSVNRILLAELGALRGVPTRLLGFSWNASPRRPAARALRAAARAGAAPLLRDPHSAARARATGVPGVVETADVVFLARSADDGLAEQARAQTRRSGARGLAVVNASALVGKRVDQVAEYRTLVEHLVASGLAVVLLPHVLRGTSDDLTACRAVAEAVAGDVPPGSVHLVERAPTPAEVRGLAASAQVVVTGRMHLAIMSLMAGVPAVTFSTQGKVSGLMEALGVPELCVEPAPGMGSRVISLLDSLQDGDVAGRLQHHLPGQRERALRNVEGLGGLHG
ncbi:hypothetical protein FHN55_17885 [Streptomyces sp. NP160]|uniref:polysaccharide pyruvyl transferase family protein n=1 Tax=Streptomyces sp. NP160 TaxID=2586637 RepID=UPI00111956D9|nr:polysaccharide pyruvyl transferase family protein [Streptomyces sp. NP160]TNM61080.1 hypothetical protein FHN55_17885 [Streptomyces sp. NP160]